MKLAQRHGINFFKENRYMAARKSKMNNIITASIKKKEDIFNPKIEKHIPAYAFCLHFFFLPIESPTFVHLYHQC